MHGFEYFVVVFSLQKKPLWISGIEHINPKYDTGCKEFHLASLHHLLIFFIVPRHLPEKDKKEKSETEVIQSCAY